MPGTKKRIKTLLLSVVARGPEGGNPLQLSAEVIDKQGKGIAGIDDPKIRQYIHELVDSFLDRLNAEWNYVMSPPPVAALLVAQIMGDVPKELRYLMDNDDPVTQLLNGMNEKWVGLGRLRDGVDGDLIANQFMEETLKEIEKVRPTDPIVPLMRDWLKQGKEHVAKVSPKTTNYLN